VPPGDVPFVSIVVPTRNRAADLRVCLSSLLAQAYPPDRFEVVVVDDGSTDETASVARAHAPRVRLLTQTPRGSSAARNAGLAAARSDPVCFVDDDIAAPPEWLDAMVAAFDRHLVADAFAGPVHAAVESVASACPEHPLASTLDVGPDDREVDAALGANMALRRRAVARVGSFDEWIAIGGADTEWFSRLHAAGGRTAYVAGAGVLHRRSATRLRRTTLLRAEFDRGAASYRYLHRRGQRDFRPHARAALPLLRHAVRDRCDGALAQAARAAGRAVGLARHWRSQPPDPPTPPTVHE
jgi:glycosyltransferase involved in cell wall biosynthesis